MKDTIDTIRSVVTSVFGVTVAELESVSRKPHLVEAREAFYVLSRESFRGSQLMLEQLTGFDYSSILVGIRRHAKKLADGFDFHPNTVAMMRGLPSTRRAEVYDELRRRVRERVENGLVGEDREKTLDEWVDELQENADGD